MISVDDIRLIALIVSGVVLALDIGLLIKMKIKRIEIEILDLTCFAVIFLLFLMALLP